MISKNDLVTMIQPAVETSPPRNILLCPLICQYVNMMNVDSFSDWVEDSWWDELP